MKLLTIFFSLFILAACGNNAHYTGVESPGQGATDLAAELDIPDVIPAGFSFAIAGTCSPDSAGNITIDSLPTGDFSPAPLTCDCVGGAIANCVDPAGSSVASVTFPGTGPNGNSPNIITTVTDPDTGETVVSEDESQMNFVDIDDNFTFIPDSNPQTLPADMGSCFPDGSPVSVAATPATSMVTSPAACTCSAGAIDCSAVDVVINDTDFTLTPTLTSPDGDVVTDAPAAADVPPVVTIDNPGGPFNPGDMIPVSGTCAVPGSAINITLPPELSLSAGTSPVVCTCTAAGTYDLSAPECGSVAITATTPGAALDIVADITDPDGDTAGPITAPVDVTPPMVDIDDNFTFIPDSAPQTLPANMGTCSPAGSAVSVAATPATSMVTSPAACTCSAGVIDCSAVSVVINNTDFTLTPTLTDASGGTYTDAPGVADVPPSLTLDPPGGPFMVGQTVPVMGTCAVPGSTVSVILPAEVNVSPGSSPVACTCTAAGTYDLSSAECGGVTVTANTPGAALDITASIADSDGDTAGPVTQPVEITPPMVDIDPAFTFNPSPTPQALPADMGSCSPSGSPVSVAATPATSMTPSPAACTCTAGAIDCSAVSVIINDADFTLTPTLTAGGAPYTDTPSVVDVPASVTIDPPPGGPFYPGDTIAITGTCAGPGSAVSVSLPAEVDVSPGTSPVACTCTAAGTYDLSSTECGGITVTANTPGDVLNITASITDPDGDTAGPVTESIDILEPEVDMSGSYTFAADTPTALPANMGTCSPDGGTVNVSDSTGSMTPSSVTCPCTAGVINCSSISATFTSVDPILTATVTVGGFGPVVDSDSSNDAVVDVPPVVDLVEVATSHLNAGDEVEIKGTCASPGDTIVVTNPTTNFVPASLTCPCDATGNFDCGVFTVDASVVLQDDVLDDATFSAVITDPDGDTGTDDEIMDCVREGLIAASGTLTYGTTYNFTEIGDASISLLNPNGNGDIQFREMDHLGFCGQFTNGVANCSIDITFSEPIPVRLTNTVSYGGNIWESIHGGARYCVDSGSTPLVFTPGTVDPVLDFSNPLCALASSPRSIGVGADDWGMLETTNTSAINIYYRATDSYNFTTVTCGIAAP